MSSHRNLSSRLLRWILFTAFAATVALPLAVAQDPTRFDEAVGAFTAAEATSPTPKGAVVCVGSSSMRKWHSRIVDDLSPLTVIPRGFGGSHFSDLNHFFDELVARHHPRAVLVYEGDNDVAGGKSPTTVLRDFLDFVEKVEALDRAIRVYVISVKPSPTRMEFWDVAETLNRRMAYLCSEYEHLEYIEVGSLFFDAEGKIMEDLFSDGVHLNDTGYDLWAARIASVVVPAESPYEKKCCAAE